MSEHTPGPWWWGRGMYNGKPSGAHNLMSGTRPAGLDIAIGGPESGYWLLEGIAGNVRARTKADAEFIVCACNSYDARTKELEEMRNALQVALSLIECFEIAPERARELAPQVKEGIEKFGGRYA